MAASPFQHQTLLFIALAIVAAVVLGLLLK
jgi:hypothetical protein